MENTNIVDKIYLALELTKIKFNNTTNSDKSEIYTSFEYFLKELTKIEDLSIMDKLKDENKTLHSLYDDLKAKVATTDLSKEKINKLIDMINDNKGDMETYVYNHLMSTLETWK